MWRLLMREHHVRGFSDSKTQLRGQIFSSSQVVLECRITDPRSGFLQAGKPAAQLRKQISAVIALTLPILSINPDGVSGTHSTLSATVAVKENKFTYPGILSSELESLDERERSYASLGRVETLSLPPEQEVEIQSGKLYLWRLCLVSQWQQTLRNCR
jgi:hypothetical protein